MKPYRATNKRLIQRGGGRFRKSTLPDIGMATCEQCGVIFVPDYSGLGEIVDSAEIRRRQRFCQEHSGAASAE